MGRAKIPMKFIEKAKKRNLCYRQKKGTLIKKVREISILCDVPICAIIFPFKEGDTKSVQAEVFSYKGSVVSDCSATNPELAREIINRYLEYPSKGVTNKKRSLVLSDMLEDVVTEDKVTSADQELYNIRYNNKSLSELSVEELNDLLGKVDHKLDYVKCRIDVIKDFDVDQPKNQVLLNNDDQFLPSDFDQEFADLMELIVPDYGKVHNLDLMGPSSSYCDNQGSGFADNYPIQCLPLMGNMGRSTYCSDQGPEFANYPLQCFPMMDPGYCNQESGYADYNLSSQCCPVYYNQGAIFSDNLPLQCRPVYYDQRSGFADNMSAFQSYSNDLSYDV